MGETLAGNLQPEKSDGGGGGRTLPFLGSLALLPSHAPPRLSLRLKTKSPIIGRGGKIFFKNWLIICAL